jgi:hypothetical protein
MPPDPSSPLFCESVTVEDPLRLTPKTLRHPRSCQERRKDQARDRQDQHPAQPLK